MIPGPSSKLKGEPHQAERRESGELSMVENTHMVVAARMREDCASAWFVGIDVIERGLFSEVVGRESGEGGVDLGL